METLGTTTVVAKPNVVTIRDDHMKLEKMLMDITTHNRVHWSVSKPTTTFRSSILLTGMLDCAGELEDEGGYSSGSAVDLYAAAVADDDGLPECSVRLGG